MANYRKSFNFRSGVQVDNDRFLVDGRGNVGVGTSAPNRPLDVYGRARINDQLETQDFQVSGVSTFQGMVSVGASIFANSETGIISATSYRGDGTLLAGVIAIATNGWVVNAGTLSTDFNAYVGPFEPGEGLDHLPVAEGSFQVGKGSSTFTVQPTGLIGLGTTLPTERLDVRGNLIVSGLSTFQSHVDITGDISVLSNFEVSGLSTFTDDVEFNNNINVDGNSEFAYINVTGISTSADLYVTGVSTFGNPNIETDNLKIDNLGNIALQPSRLITFSGNNTSVGIRWTSSLGMEIYNDYNLGGDDRKITIQSLREGDIVLKGQYDNRAVFTNNGATITGITSTTDLIVAGVSTFSSETNFDGVVNIPDGDGIKFGTSSDYAQLYSSSGEFYLRNTEGSGSGTLLLQGRTGVHIYGGGTAIDDLGLSVESGVSLLKHQGTTKAQTADYGFGVTGRLTTNDLSSSGISTFNTLRSNSIGIGTNVFSSDLILNKDSSVSVDFVSTQGSVTLSLGRDLSGGNNSSIIKYIPTSENLEISNRGSGDLTFRTHTGTGDLIGVTTGGFLFRTGQSDTILAHLRSDGRFAVNQEVSEDQELDFNLISNGNALVKGNLQVLNNLDLSAGIATILDLEVTNPAVFPSNQNFNTTSGTSTLSDLRINDLFSVTGISSFIGVTTHYGTVCFGIKDPENGELYGAEADSIVKSYNEIRTFGSQIGLSSSPIYYDYLTAYDGEVDSVGPIQDPRDQNLLANYIADPTKIIPAFGYGDIQLKTGGMSIITQDYINIHPSIAQSTTGSWTGLTPAENIGMGLEYVNNTNLCMVGINTLFTRSIVDIGFAGPTMNSYIIPPRLNTADIATVSILWDPVEGNGLPGHTRSFQSTPDGLVTGGILFDIQKNQLKVATDSKTFSGIATFTNNGSGYESFVPPTVTNTQRTTLTDAGIPAGSVVYNTTNDALEQYDGTTWTSYVKKSTSDDISISVSGSNLVITVAGVGSTSLTLA